MIRLRKDPGEVSGPAKKNRKTKQLIGDLLPGDIAVIHHRDLDELAAESLCTAKVKAVINTDSSMTGRYLNNGPAKLAAAKIIHLDEAGQNVYERIQNNDPLTVRDDGIWRGSEFLGRGRVVNEALIARQMRLAESNLGEMLDSFVQNTLEYALKEKELILGKLELPKLKTNFKNKHVLVVVRGQSYREDLEAVKHYVDEVRPVLVGVDGGADALMEFGYTPDLVVGDMDSVSDLALTRAREIVVHAYTDGRAPGMDRINELGLPAITVQAPGTSEDITFLLAYEFGAKLICAIGTHSNMIDFLEKGRKGMASTFLVRLKVGNRLVDARGVSQLYRSRVSGRSLILITLAASIPVLALAIANPTIRHIFGLIAMRLRLGM